MLYHVHPARGTVPIESPADIVGWVGNREGSSWSTLSEDEQDERLSEYFVSLLSTLAAGANVIDVELELPLAQDRRSLLDLAERNAVSVHRREGHTFVLRGFSELWRPLLGMSPVHARLVRDGSLVLELIDDWSQVFLTLRTDGHDVNAHASDDRT